MSDETYINQLIDAYERLMPQTVYLAKDKAKYGAVLQSVEAIKSFVQDFDDGAKIKIAPDDLTGSSLIVEIETTLVVVDVIDKFCEALKVADNFEIYARRGGNIGIGIVYEDVYKPVQPKKK